MRKAFAVFDIANNAYGIWRWADFNGNNVRGRPESFIVNWTRRARKSVK